MSTIIVSQRAHGSILQEVENIFVFKLQRCTYLQENEKLLVITEKLGLLCSLRTNTVAYTVHLHVREAALRQQILTAKKVRVSYAYQTISSPNVAFNQEIVFVRLSSYNYEK